MKRQILILAAAAVVFCTVAAAAGTFPDRPEDVEGYGMFSWNEETVRQETEESLHRCMERAGVTEVYQQFDFQGTDTSETAALVKTLKKGGASVYALMGEPEWARERHADRLIEKIHDVVAYNEKRGRDDRIFGIMVDVEPYLLDEWDAGSDARQALMEDYLRGMEYAFAYARKNKLKFIVCIPNFYDATNPDILEGLIAYACDGVAVMNYNRSDEYGQIAKEAGFAREYGKEIICIFELQEAGRHGLSDINTYADEGLEELWKSAGRPTRQFGYENMRFAYHYYEPLKELLEGE